MQRKSLIDLIEESDESLLSHSWATSLLPQLVSQGYKNFTGNISSLGKAISSLPLLPSLPFWFV